MIETERLLLRAWRTPDAEAHYRIVRHPRTVAMLGLAPRRAEAAAAMARQNRLLREYGYCFWAMEERATGALIGWCGVQPGKPPIERDTEIGWTLAADRWGRGYAREAAAATLRWTWANTDLPRIAAVTTPNNARSRRLMEWLGMTRSPADDFDHPWLSADDPLLRHVMYRIARPDEA